MASYGRHNLDLVQLIVEVGFHFVPYNCSHGCSRRCLYSHLLVHRIKKKGLSVAIGVASPDENGELKIELGNSVAAAGQGDEGTEFSESVRNK